MPRLGFYHDLDNEPDDQFSISLPMKDVVSHIMSLNYGQHRFVSELVLQRRESRYYHRDYGDYIKYTEMLADLLTAGFF